MDDSVARWLSPLARLHSPVWKHGIPLCKACRTGYPKGVHRVLPPVVGLLMICTSSLNYYSCDFLGNVRPVGTEGKTSARHPLPAQCCSMCVCAPPTAVRLWCTQPGLPARLFDEPRQTAAGAMKTTARLQGNFWGISGGVHVSFRIRQSRGLAEHISKQRVG